MERLTAGRLLAFAQSIRTRDLATSDALASHAEWLAQAELALREANIQLAAPEHQTASAQALRDHIDALLGIVPRAMPISQVDGS